MGSRPPWTILASLVAPVIVLGGVASVLLDLENQRGTGRHDGLMETIEEAMASDPEVVVVGDSLARDDLEPAAFARHLQKEQGEVARLGIAGSGAPTWYALLDNHVFGKGHRPKTIVIVASLRSMLQQVPGSPAQEEILHELMDDDDALLEARTRGWKPWLYQALRVGRVKAKRKLLHRIRGEAVGALFGQGSGAERIRGAVQLSEQATAKVFDARTIDLHHARAMLGGLDARILSLPDDDELPSIEESWMPDFVRLARSYGAEVVFVKPPLSPLMPRETWDTVPEALAPGLEALGREPGVVWIDDTKLPVPHAGFRDESHMVGELTRRYAKLVGARIRFRALPAEPLAVDLLADEATALTELPVLSTLQPRPGTAKMWNWAIPQLPELLDRLVMAGVHSSCLPVEVHQDGRPLGQHPEGCPGLMNSVEPGICFDSEFLWARTSPPMAPAELKPNAARGCGSNRWLYPKDGLRWELPDGGNLVIAAASDAPITLEVRARIDGEPTRQIWRTRASDREVLPIPRGVGELEVRNLSGSSIVLITELGRK